MKCKNHAVCGNEAPKREALCEPCKKAVRAQAIWEWEVYVVKKTNRLSNERKNGKK